MHLINPDSHGRRAFLKRSAALAGAGVALPTAINLAALGEAAAFNATDYKALVCVFLYGGSDHANTVVSFDDANYANYARIRGGSGQAGGGIALAKADLNATFLNSTRVLPGGAQFALHPAMSGMRGLFENGKAAVQLNVGPLVVPMARAEYDSRRLPLPPKLFSHNDQQSIWQSSRPEGSTVGWGGNIGDLALSSNGENSLFTCISATGNAVFLAGDQALSYQVGNSGAVKIRSATNTWTYGSQRLRTALLDIAQQSRSHVLENEYNRVVKRAIGAEVRVSAALDATKAVNNVYPAPFNAFGSGNNLADQLRVVARFIAARQSLGVKRQVYLVSMGGFDLHDDLIARQPVLLQRLSEAMTAFYNTTEALGVARDVTAFTATDFGRTLNSNGDGSDHGWGSHQFVVGGAVNGKNIYGYAPPMANGSAGPASEQWHVGQGRLIPTTSVDQFAATLGSWFGVEEGELNGILPNLRNFGSSSTFGGEVIDYPRNLGFMARTPTA
jgi:uncharacterized protein (DUF1501 family)